MKVPYFMLAILGIALLVSSCQQESPEQLTIIKGTFKNATTTEAYLLGNLRVSRPSELDENGSFTDTLDIDADAYLTTSAGGIDFPLFIKKGSTTAFTVDLKTDNPSL